jgi:hypothetical protein
LPPSNVPAKVPQHLLRFNLAVANKSSGFYANHSPNSPIFHSNTALKNGANYNMTGVGGDGSTTISVGVLRNNLAFGSTATSDANLSGPIDSSNNSWDAKPSVTVSNSDFLSVAFAPPAACPAPYAPGGTVCVPPSDMTSFGGLASERQADGSLPVLPFMHLAPGSALIDQGVDIGSPFVGKAPDLGAFEFGSDETAAGAAGSGGVVAVGMGGEAGTGAAAGGSAPAGGGVNAGGPPASSANGGAGGRQPVTAGVGAGAAGNAGSSGRAAASGGAPASIGAVVAGSGSVLPAGGAASPASPGCSCQVGRRSNSRLVLPIAVLGALSLLRLRSSRRRARS